LIDEEAVKAYINKRESQDYYLDAFETFAEDNNSFKWKWSWWAFGGGAFFLLYRKLYMEAIVFFLITITASKIPIASLIIWVMSGGIFSYFVYKRYLKTYDEIGQNVSGRENQLEALRMRGGFNNWALGIAVAINMLVVAYLFFVILAVYPGMTVAMPD